MRFKQLEQKEEGLKLSDSLKRMLAIEVDKIALIEAAICYFYIHGNTNYCKFFKELHKLCMKCKLDLQMHICITAAILPQTTTHDIKLEDFESDIKVFELLAAMEDEYIDSLSAAISEAFDNKNWETFSYLNNVLDKVDHIACRAHSAVKSHADILSLLPCEQHS